MILSIFLIISPLLGGVLCNQYSYQGHSQPPPPYPNGNRVDHQHVPSTPNSQSQFPDDRNLPPAPHMSQYPPNQPIYRRGYQPQVQQESFFSKVRNSIVAASNAIAGSLDNLQTPDQRGGYGYPNEYYANPPPQGYPHGYENSYDRRHVPEANAGKNIVGKLKSLFTGEGEQQAQDYSSHYPHVPPMPQSHQQHPPQHGAYSQPPPQQQQQRSMSDTPPRGMENYHSGYPRGPGDLVENLPESPEGSPYPAYPPYPQQGREEPPRMTAPPNALAQRPPHPAHPSHPGHPANFPPKPAVEELLERISSDPQVLIHEDNVVMILKPKEFFRKKYALMTGGSNNLQVFTDFEHAFTRFKVDTTGAGSDKGGNERSLSTLELLELSGALSPEALQRIQQLNKEYDQQFCQLVNEDGSTNEQNVYQLYEEMSLQYQQIIAKYGNLYSGNVFPATKELLSRVGLRQGWKESLQALASKGVPTFIFSSGFGDIIANIMLLNDLTEANPASFGMSRSPSAPANAAPVLPNNIRIISNFFRTAPDYSVRAFSQPIVHEKNKNVTTAERFMGMPAPSRPNALVLGSNEDDIHMTDGLPNLQNQLSVGFLELSDDLPQRLSSYLNTFDAVIVGDSSCSYVKSLIEEILQLPQVSNNAQPTLKFGGFGNIRNKLGQLLGDGGSSNNNLNERKRPFDYNNF